VVADIFDTKVINNEKALDGTPFVVPETRGRSPFIVAFGNRVGCQPGGVFISTIMVLTHKLALLD
jgi:hypothetical protein